VDKLTYAGSLANLASVKGHANHQMAVADVCDLDAMRTIIADFSPDALMHLAAESHVDRSIDGPAEFVRTNIFGTYALLEAVRDYRATTRRECRFVQVSTDEVYGSLGADGRFTEQSPLRPNSPYAASKAAADHLARAWQKTFGVPVIITNCSNNYGPYQFPEKLIPLTILRALRGQPIPIYGDGRQIRDWLHVDDHVRALVAVLSRGRPGRTYNIGGDCERTNISVVRTVLRAVAANQGMNEEEMLDLIEFVPDRPGHDRRYAIDSARIAREFAWAPRIEFDAGIAATVKWYIENVRWRQTTRKRYAGDRLGLAADVGIAAPQSSNSDSSPRQSTGGRKCDGAKPN